MLQTNLLNPGHADLVTRELTELVYLEAELKFR